MPSNQLASCPGGWIYVLMIHVVPGAVVRCHMAGGRLRLTAGCPLIIRIHMEISATFLESLHNVVYVLVVPLRPSRCWPDVGDARHY